MQILRSSSMRPLTEEETKQVFEKLYKFIGKNIKNLVDRPDEPHCFRLQKNRVYYVRESLMKKATNVRAPWGPRGGEIKPQQPPVHEPPAAGALLLHAPHAGPLRASMQACRLQLAPSFLQLDRMQSLLVLHRSHGKSSSHWAPALGN